MYTSPQNSPNEKTLAKPLLFGEFCGEITKIYYSDSPQNSPNKKTLAKPLLFGEFCGEITKKIFYRFATKFAKGKNFRQITFVWRILWRNNKIFYTDSPQNSPNKSSLGKSFLIGDFSGEVYIYLNSH